MGQHKRNPTAIAKARGELEPRETKPPALYRKGEIPRTRLSGIALKARRRR